MIYFMKTRIIVTGGTIDKIYNVKSGLPEFGITHINDMLGRGRVTADTIVQELLMKDSLDMTDEDRQAVVTACEDSPESQILITHGTDKMPETAREISRSQKIGGKVIVLTGAMVPYSFGEASDAMFNFGTGLAFAEALPEGVYVAMNGQAFDADDVRKNKDLGVFTVID